MTDGRRDLQFQYNLLNLPAVTETLESIAHDKGRFVALSASPGTTTAQFIDTWHVRDTSEVNDPALAVLEQNDYMPFGTRISHEGMAYDQSNRYRIPRQIITLPCILHRWRVITNNQNIRKEYLYIE